MPVDLSSRPQAPYLLPDHWVLHKTKPDDTFTVLHSAYISWVVSILKAAKVKTVLEVGCGDGWACNEMVKAGLKVVGTDFIQNAITYASTLVPGAEFICGDLASEEFKMRFPDKFDAIAMIEVLEHIPPIECVSALRNIIEPLKSGGLFVLTTPSENFPNDNIHHYQHFTENKLSDLVKQAGDLEILSIEGYGDVEIERSHWNKMRWFDNRYYSIKPGIRMLNRRFADAKLIKTPLSRSHGLVAVMRKA